MRSVLQRSIMLAVLGCMTIGGYVVWQQADESPVPTAPLIPPSLLSVVVVFAGCAVQECPVRPAAKQNVPAGHERWKKTQSRCHTSEADCIWHGKPPEPGFLWPA